MVWWRTLGELERLKGRLGYEKRRQTSVWEENKSRPCAEETLMVAP